jgi:hypothetical protein
MEAKLVKDNEFKTIGLELTTNGRIMYQYGFRTANKSCVIWHF